MARKSSKSTRKPRKYDKPLSLHPLTPKQALAKAMEAPPEKKSAKKRRANEPHD